MVKIDRRKRLYYPYCGYRTGFCLAPNMTEKGCTMSLLSPSSCRYWRARHPVTKVIPQSLYLREEDDTD